MSRPKTPQLKRIRKVWGKGLASLPLLDGYRERKDDNRYEIKDIPVGQNTQFDVTPDNAAELARILLDDRLARRVREMQSSQFPYGTVPELVIYEFLQKKGVSFKYQVQLFGGYRGGGLVPDFVIDSGGSGHVWLIQGIYWHNIPGKREKDQSDKMRMLGTYFDGELINRVTFIWENQIMQPNPMREVVLENALLGIETAARIL